MPARTSGCSSPAPRPALPAAEGSPGYGLRILTDPSDRLIVATALTLGLPLITADSAITDSGRVPVVG